MEARNLERCANRRSFIRKMRAQRLDQRRHRQTVRPGRSCRARFQPAAAAERPSGLFTYELSDRRGIDEIVPVPPERGMWTPTGPVTIGTFKSGERDVY